MKLPYEDKALYFLDGEGGFFIYSGRLKQKEWEYLIKWAAWNGFIIRRDDD